MMLRMVAWLTAILAPLQLFIGDQHGRNTLKHQPIKIAAMEAPGTVSNRPTFTSWLGLDEKAERN